MRDEENESQSAQGKEVDVGTATGQPAGDLPADWRKRAGTLHERANKLGDCRAGLALFTEASTLRYCADQLQGRETGLKLALAELAACWRQEYRDVPGPVRGPGADVLQDCADQLAALFTGSEADHG